MPTLPTATAGQVPAPHSTFTELNIYLAMEPCPNCGTIPHDSFDVEGAYKTGNVDLLKEAVLLYRKLIAKDGTTKVFCNDCEKTFEVPEHLLPKPVAKPVDKPTQEPAKRTAKAKRSVANPKKQVVEKQAKGKVKKQTPILDADLNFDGINITEILAAVSSIAYANDLEGLIQCDANGLVTHLKRKGVAYEPAHPTAPTFALPVDAEPPISHKEAAARLKPYNRTGTCSTRTIRTRIASGDLTPAGTGRIDPASVREYIKKKKMQANSRKKKQGRSKN